MSSHNYILSKRIARGGMAEIFLGKVLGSEDFQRIVAIKRILPHYAQEREYIEMFRAEASICKRLQHANIVQVYDFNRVDDSYAIIMEFVDGNDLRSLLAACEKTRVRLTVPMAVFIAAQAARGLHYAHTRVDEVSRKPLEIVHRDISPQNLLISYEGEVKVIDFGIAKFEAKNQETKPGVVKGKYSYMSPEQVTAKALDARTDVFSLSIVLWEVLAMKRLFAGESEVETIKNVQNGIIKKSLRDLNSRVDEHLYRIILKGLAKDRRKRYQSAAELEKDLLRYLNSRYPEFTASDLGNFVRQIFAKKRSEAQKAIQKLLSEPTDLNQNTTNSKEGRGGVIKQAVPTKTTNDSPPASGTNSSYNTPDAFIADPSDKNIELNLNDIANSSTPILPLATGNNRKVVFDVTTPPPESRNTGSNSQPSRGSGNVAIGNRARKRRSRRQHPGLRDQSRLQKSTNANVVLAGALIAMLLIGLGVYFHRGQNQAKGTMQIKLDTRPNKVQLRVDGKIQQKGRYIKTPTRIKLPAGQHTIQVERQGYLPRRIEVPGKRGGFYTTPMIVLQRNPSARLVRVQFRVTPRRPVVIDIDNGLFRGRAPTVVPNLTAGIPHTVVVYPNSPRKSGAFRCEFTARNRGQPYVLTIQIREGGSRCVASP